MKRETRIILLNQAKEEYVQLTNKAKEQEKKGQQNTEEMQLLKSINKKIDLIRKNPFYGDNIEKRKIPKTYNVQNLWRVELTKYWRMLYTIKGDEIEIICFVLDILNHKEYSKKFGYGKK